MLIGDGCCCLGTSWQGQGVAAGITMLQAISTGLALKQALHHLTVQQGMPRPSSILPQQQKGTRRAQLPRMATALGNTPQGPGGETHKAPAAYKPGSRFPHFK